MQGLLRSREAVWRSQQGAVGAAVPQDHRTECPRSFSNDRPGASAESASETEGRTHAPLGEPELPGPSGHADRTERANPKCRMPLIPTVPAS